tara:strand:+ start:65 stop:646 length:582 start_codon:yes stop_codon:yes gene_type:complete
MNRITIIIGLQGSGKTTYTYNLSQGEAVVYSDWGWQFSIDENDNITSSFNEEYRFNDLINNIKGSKNIIIEGSYFCNHKFMCEAEYYLNLNFPNIEIEKFYFENNSKDSTANVLYREYVGGNHWKKNENGNLIFYGHHYTGEGPNHGRRNYEVIIENINKLSKNYIIPSRYTPIKVQLQDEKFYEGWRTLIRE